MAERTPIVFNDFSRLTTKLLGRLREDAMVRERARETFLREMQILADAGRKLKHRSHRGEHPHSGCLADQAALLGHILTLFEDCYSDLQRVLDSREESVCKAVVEVESCAMDLKEIVEELMEMKGIRDEHVTRLEIERREVTRELQDTRSELDLKSQRMCSDLARLEDIAAALEQENDKLLRDNGRLSEETRRLEREVDRLCTELERKDEALAKLHGAQRRVHELTAQVQETSRERDTRAEELKAVNREAEEAEREARTWRAKAIDFEKRFEEVTLFSDLDYG
jgi:DNA repair exonuclease SbcCD ATPase subunit